MNLCEKNNIEDKIKESTKNRKNLNENKSKNFTLHNDLINPIFKPLKKWSGKIIETRLLKEFKDLKDIYFNEEGFQIYGLVGNKIFGVLEGPPKTSFENGFFLFEILFSDDYPFSPPQFIFKTKIFHPNIDENGIVCAHILDDWHPSIFLIKFILSIQSLLDAPIQDNFLNENASKLYKENKYLYENTVKDYTSKYANYSIFKEEINKIEFEKLDPKEIPLMKGFIKDSKKNNDIMYNKKNKNQKKENLFDSFKFVIISFIIIFIASKFLKYFFKK